MRLTGAQGALLRLLPESAATYGVRVLQGQMRSISALAKLGLVRLTVGWNQFGRTPAGDAAVANGGALARAVPASRVYTHPDGSKALAIAPQDRHGGAAMSMTRTAAEQYARDALGSPHASVADVFEAAIKDASAEGERRGREAERGDVVDYLIGVSEQLEGGDGVEQDDFAAEAYGQAAHDILALKHVRQPGTATTSAPIRDAGKEAK